MFHMFGDVPHVEAAIVIDDVLEERAWPQAHVIRLETETNPGENISAPINAVITRTIADPDFGARLTGNTEAGAFGILAAEDAVTNLIFPGATAEISAGALLWACCSRRGPAAIMRISSPASMLDSGRVTTTASSSSI
jgi:hypothetical protein